MWLVKTENGNEQDRAVVSSSESSAAAFDAMREQLRQGIKVVGVPQLFPTPAWLAERMVELAAIEPGHAVLEPSAGTGRILTAIRTVESGSTIRTAVEIVGRLCDELRSLDTDAHVCHEDFLQCEEKLGKFDRILMNPPFANAQDVAHIKYALRMLKPGGRLVAICANGSRQNAQLRPLVEQCDGKWEVLPSETFIESGTSVSTVLLTLTV